MLDKNRKVAVYQISFKSSSIPIIDCFHLWLIKFLLTVVFKKKCHEMFSAYLLLYLLSAYLLGTYVVYHL